MKKFWSYVDNKNWKNSTKFKMALLLLSLIFALAGFLVWLIVSIWALSGLDWMVCFICYPMVASWFLTYIYYCNHNFHS